MTSVVPMPDRLQMYNLLLRLGVDDVLTPEFRSQVDLQGPARHQREVWAMPAKADPLNRTLAFDWRFTLAESDLPKVRGTTAMAGVSVGFPMLYDQLLAFSLGLPVSYKLKGLKLRGSSRRTCAASCPTKSSPSASRASDCPSACGSRGIRP